VRIFDTFPFDGELELLDHRLRETFDLVDVFVLVEAAQTYRGAPKPLTFRENAAQFDWARRKVRHIALSSLGPASATPRERAAAQRNAIVLALRDAAPDDHVLLLDVDEVPSRSLLQRLRGHRLEGPTRLAMTRHYGFADTLGPRSPCCPTGADPFPAAVPRVAPGAWERLDEAWHGRSGVAAPFSAFARSDPFTLRFWAPPGAALPDAGRHFSSVDPAAALARKLGRVFHEEHDGPRETSPVHLARCRRYWVHHRGWWLAERPRGAMPADVARLVERHPALAAGPEPSRFVRRLARTWAWLRLSGTLPGPLVAAVDRGFDTWLPALAPVLLACDAGRAAAARLLRLLPARRLSPMPHH
jgi:beta-1,4-mannosyl-glycoprotein beta-1,4-N-acetylglucosaminyltransferase